MTSSEPGGATVVTLCGSRRFSEEFERLELELSLAGHVVLAPTGLSASTELDVEQRARLGRVHLRKVAMADEILVVDVGGYIGESTRREIEYARSCGVVVRYLETPAPAPMPEAVDPGVPRPS